VEANNPFTEQVRMNPAKRRQAADKLEKVLFK
jgi:hypothetical protein